MLTLGATGLAREKGIAETERAFVFADLKGDLDQIGHLAGGLVWKRGRPGMAASRARGNDSAAEPMARPQIPSASPGNSRGASPNDSSCGRTPTSRNWNSSPLCAGYRAARAALRYKPLSRFPAVERDFSLVLADGTAFAAVAETIRSLGIAEISSIDAVDVFRGKNVPAGKFSLLVRVTFESHQATLTEAQLTDFSSRILAALEQKLGAALRA